MPTLLPSLLLLLSADTTLVADLPLVEARAARPGHTIAVLCSGDGNWASFVKGLSRGLNDAGISVIGLKSRAYLTGNSRKDPDSAGQDLTRILRAYLPAWQADTVLVIGYSRGAELAPFMVSRLPEELRRSIGLVALLSPAVNASFEFHLVDLVSDRRRPGDLELLPEVRKLRGARMLCVYGIEDANALCPVVEPGLMTVVSRARGHRLEDPQEIAALIIRTVQTPSERPGVP